MSLKTAFPGSLQDNDQETRHLIKVIDKGLNSLGITVDSVRDEFDIVKMKPESVERWLKAFGWKWEWTDDRRLLLKLLISMYKGRGTTEGIIRTLKLMGGPFIEIREPWPEAYAAGHDLDDDEKVKIILVLPAELTHYFSTVIRVTEFMKPGHAELAFQSRLGSGSLQLVTSILHNFLFPYLLCGTFNASDNERWAGRLLRLKIGTGTKAYWGPVYYRLCGTFNAGGELT